MSKRKIHATDIFNLISLTDPQWDKHSRKFAFVQTTMHEEDNEYRSAVYIGDLEGKTIPFTTGKGRATSPRWSPDGSKLAFVSNRNEKSQIYVMPANGGEAEQVTFCKNGARGPVWSPCGTKILFSTSVEGVQDLQQDEEEKKKKKHPEPLVVEKMRYKSDAKGFLDEKNDHLALLDLKTKEISLLTDGDRDYGTPAWSPDGKSIAFVTNLEENPDVSLVSDVYVMDLETKEKKKITNSNGFYSALTFSPDGQYLGFLGHEKEFQSATLSRVWVTKLESGETHCLSENLDVEIGDVAIGDFHSGNVNPGLMWTEDSEGFYFLMSDQGGTGIYFGSLDGAMYPIHLPDEHVYAVSMLTGTHEAIVGVSNSTDPGELYHFDLKSQTRNQLTNVNESWKNEVELCKAEPIQFKAKDGWELHGWIMKPAGFEEGKKYPTILEVHGGPHAMYANTYFHEFQTLTAQGFVVLFTNPRGSHGYGQHFVDAVRGDYGGKDYLDVMSAMDYALESFDFIDENKLGITGGSYGGFMTNWVVGHTNRFKAAVTQRSISNWLSFYGVSDIGYYFSEWEVQGNMEDKVEKLWEHSPIKYVSNIQTPLLILHGEKDYRCPVEQAEQLFIALKKQGKTTKLVRFPEANHELSRSGDLALRIHRLNHVKNWFVEYLQKA
ncbi:S9 family peptidase [Sutcliffiella rhizosphaerae]|uniref:Dipeptidyl-peptidase 5 n=1 Tax=Sutcliffiella rhizosphaerae TaxID=2880967 RepID=A0ABN8AJA1_9BACI|nr:S9 family peptidase [Sutcliffiella rhizosphaerae]CAG9622975.1 Dipeptidyl-peptidase 5 [Sutcliffiella rhizosphaerae]